MAIIAFLQQKKINASYPVLIRLKELSKLMLCYPAVNNDPLVGLI